MIFSILISLAGFVLLLWLFFQAVRLSTKGFLNIRVKEYQKYQKVKIIWLALILLTSGFSLITGFLTIPGVIFIGLLIYYALWRRKNFQKKYGISASEFFKLVKRDQTNRTLGELINEYKTLS